MGLFDKLRKHAPEIKERATEAATTHHDRIDGAIDKAAGAANRVTGGKHAARIDDVADKAKGGVDRLGDRHDPGSPGGRVAPR